MVAGRRPHDILLIPVGKHKGTGPTKVDFIKVLRHLVHNPVQIGLTVTDEIIPQIGLGAVVVVGRLMG